MTKEPLREALERYDKSSSFVQAIESGYSEWQQGGCNEIGCGCVTVYIAHALAKALAAQPDVSKGEGLTFVAFSKTNRLRCESKDGFNHQLSSWSTSDWFLALLGELGEAANVAKKLNRYRDGIPGNKVSKEELETQLRCELGDSFVYLDLLAQSLGVGIGEAAVEVFNSKSVEIGCSIKFEAALPSQPAATLREAPKNLQAEPPYPGLETVVMSMRAPEWTIHMKNSRCDKDYPHQTIECGEWPKRGNERQRDGIYDTCES